MSTVDIRREYAPITSATLELGDHQLRVGSVVPTPSRTVLASFSTNHDGLYRGHAAGIQSGDLHKFAMALLELVAQAEVQGEA